MGSARWASSICPGAPQALKARSISSRAAGPGTPPKPSPATLLNGEPSSAKLATPPAIGIVKPAVPAARPARCARPGQCRRTGASGSWGRDASFLGEQSVLYREQRGGGPARRAGLGVDVLHVVAGRLRRDDQSPGDLLVRHAARQQDEYLDLAG